MSFHLQDIVIYIYSLKMEQPSLPPPSSSTSASQNSQEEVRSEDMKSEVEVLAGEARETLHQTSICYWMFAWRKKGNGRGAEKLLVLSVFDNLKKQSACQKSDFVYCITP